MKNSKHKHENTIINKYKLIYTPLIIGLISIIMVSSTIYYVSKNLLIQQMRQDGLNVTKQTLTQIKDNASSLKLINYMLEDKIKIASKTVLQNKNNLSNDFLANLAKDLNVDELNWMNKYGKILYSSNKKYIGWIPSKNHPLYNFVLSDANELIEDIRPEGVSGNPFKFGAIKNSDSSFVQVGISAANIQKLTQQFSYQSLVKGLCKENNIIYAFIVNENLKTIASGHDIDSDTVFNAYKHLPKAIKGTVSMIDVYNREIDAKVLNISAPIYLNNQIVGAITIGFSMKNVYYSINIIFVTFCIIVSVVFLIFLYFQIKNVINPVKQLNKNISKIDIENNIDYRLPLIENDTFWGLTFSINNILEKTYGYFHELSKSKEALNASNAEISATYQQLLASEETLRFQYDEIQHYAHNLERLNQEIEHLAYHDPLTGLPNRRKFIEKFEQEINNHNYGAIMLLDLDNFKGINDILGHVYGDNLLKKVAEELMNIKDEKLFISRFGGDEFLILINGENDVSKIDNYAKKIISIFRNKLIIEKDEINIRCSMGVTLYPSDSSEINQLIMNADMAMYKVKYSGKNNYVFFNEEMIEHLKNKANVEKILNEALLENGFKLLYQPQVCSQTGKIISFEALLRLKEHNISPAIFIPIAEETGIIPEIGRWVTKEVVKQLSIWKKKNFELKPIGINFSVKQLIDLNYFEFLQDLLSQNDVDAKYIDIEITESVLLDKKHEAIEFLNNLRLLGASISLDDFGTGYSSLSYLTFLPVDKIKLDKSLSDKFLENEKNTVMDNIISLAHSLNLKVVAEGIENTKQLNHLKMAECDYIQGYIFSKPLSIEETENIYNDNLLEKINSINNINK